MPESTRRLCYAIVRQPARSLLDACELTHLDRVAIDADGIAREHAAYRDVLAAMGLSVTVLPAIEAHPDSVFMEDTAVVLEEVLVLSRPTRSREAEPAHLLADAGALGRPVARITAPGTLEGGDVLRVGRQLMVGLTTRTNAEGVAQLRAIAKPFGYTVESFAVGRSLHFKTACTALDEGLLLVNPEWVDAETLRAAGFDLLAVPGDEPFAANLLRVDDRVLVNAAAPKTAALVREAWRARGHAPDALFDTPLVEFGKAEAGLTCLSLVYAAPAST
ncbi:dimethylarginine dimethylaminohydrolase family protein [Silanimonas sp.]|jgi:dimethylargininase|uniref:dimethylarginine dimethylaminohydrolase family protein n=1 Tax=Silanimonas sp. TaxID=1929290 RepID=UPI0037C7D8E0